MDRFIAPFQLSPYKKILYLKSNMDRFIENIAECQLMFAVYLKSNMDRFIVFPFIFEILNCVLFKIQYG